MLGAPDERVAVVVAWGEELAPKIEILGHLIQAQPSVKVCNHNVKMGWNIVSRAGLRDQVIPHAVRTVVVDSEAVDEVGEGTGEADVPFDT